MTYTKENFDLKTYVMLFKARVNERQGLTTNDLNVRSDKEFHQTKRDYSPDRCIEKHGSVPPVAKRTRFDMQDIERTPLVRT